MNYEHFMSDEEYMQELLDRGYSRTQAKYKTEDAIAKSILQDPELVANLRKLIKEAGEAEARRRKEEQDRLERTARMLVTASLPNINTNVPGLVAFRVWKLGADYSLLSTVIGYTWKAINISDIIPSEGNQHGFYCVRLTALNTLAGMRGYFHSGLKQVSGFIELRGKVIEHTDGILRAEWARILCLFVTSDNPAIESVVHSLHQNYPFIPIHILNPEQLALVVMRETVYQKVRGGNQ